MHSLAQELNKTLAAGSGPAMDLLSTKGKNAYFPSKGILGQSAQAKGKRINATIGTAFEEDGSALVLESLQDMVGLPASAFLYAPSPGNPQLRQVWKDMMLSKNPGLVGQDCSLPVVSCALTHALSVTGLLFVDEGDEIILPDMYWDNYDLVFKESYGAVIKTYNTFKQGAYDVEAFATALNEGGTGKKIVLLNFPNNPTGYTISDEEAKAISAEIEKAAEAGNKILVVLDDAYFGLVYKEGVTKESMFSLLANVHENVLTVKLDGPTKEDYVWGFRVGFITYGFSGSTPEQLKALEAKTGGAVRGTISNAPNISQQFLLNLYQSDEYIEQKEDKYNTLKKRYQKIVSILEAHPEYKDSYEPMPFNSGYFMCVKLNGVDPEAVRLELLESYDTGVIVLSGVIRLAFSAVPLALLEDLFSNLHNAVKKVKSS